MPKLFGKKYQPKEDNDVGILGHCV